MAASPRPHALHVSRSFTRMDNTSPSPLSPRKRASTLQEVGIPAIPEARHIDSSQDLEGHQLTADVFENTADDDEVSGERNRPEDKPELHAPSTFDELPVEIKSLCERFLNSLSAKVHPTPLNADQLAELFQDFYERAAGHIATHIASLASRIGRETPPASSASSSSRKQLGRSRAGSGATKGSSDDLAGHAEMLTVEEVADRKKARRLLEHKRIDLEEAVERGVCEKVYDKIWKHRSTDDDARDEKLRSRTAALSLVGIGLKELHTDNDPAKGDSRQTAVDNEDEISASLSAAREALQRMDDDRYPLGKLQHLTAAHKSIVETLSQFFPSSSSADEILPTLIYTLITSPQTGINVVSNLNFVQRFRASNKVDGEAAYCLVNLEAAISFLETVDLSSLRADELPQGPGKRSGATTPASKDQPASPTSSPMPTLARTLTSDLSPITAAPMEESTPETAAKATLPSSSTPGSSRPQMHQRRISGLMQAQVERIEASRDNILSAADKVYESINGTLDNSLQFVFGRFKEKVPDNSPLPKTLEDARKLVSSPVRADDDESLDPSGRSSPAIDDPLNASSKSENKVLELLGGRKQLRERSVDSARSGGSGRRVTFDSKTAAAAAREKASKEEQPPLPQGNLFSSTINNINSMNPLTKFGMPTFPKFGRTSAGNPPLIAPSQPSPAEKGWSNTRVRDIVESPSTIPISEQEPSSSLERTQSQSSEAGLEDLSSREALAELRRLKPPKKRFLEVQSAAELRLGEVDELLRDYRRLAKAIGQTIAQ